MIFYELELVVEQGMQVVTRADLYKTWQLLILLNLLNIQIMTKKKTKICQLMDFTALQRSKKYHKLKRKHRSQSLLKGMYKGLYTI